MSHKPYQELLSHYTEMLESFDMIHFNSEVCQEVYTKHIEPSESSLLAITHAQIEDKRRARKYDKETLNILFIGNKNSYKGLPLLEEVLIELLEEGVNNWHLKIWGTEGQSPCPNIIYMGRYTSTQLEQIYKQDSLLIVPSQWNETFSFVTLEALSYATPTLVSSTVGAKEIVNEYDPWFVYKTKSELKNKITELVEDRSKLRNFNLRILKQMWHHTLENHARAMLHLYTKNL